MFAFQFVYPETFMSFFGLGTTTGKCNLMGYWHIGNTDIEQPNATLKAIDTAICTDTCTQSLCGWTSNTVNNRSNHFRTTPLVDFATTGAPLSANDYLYYKDIISIPAIAGGIVPIFNIPEITSNPSLYLILSRSTLANIFLGNLNKRTFSFYIISVFLIVISMIREYTLLE